MTEHYGALPTQLYRLRVCLCVCVGGWGVAGALCRPQKRQIIAEKRSCNYAPYDMIFHAASHKYELAVCFAAQDKHCG